jgi:leucyl aminopeptidase (aminopeptidase T)
LPHKSPEARKAWEASYREKHREAFRRRSREFRARHLERVRAEARLVARLRHEKLKNDPTYKARQLAKAMRWYAKNAAKAKLRIASYRRNAVIVPQQTPKWANKFFISEIYHLAKLRTRYLGVPHEVDHVIPLRGKNVCGLHVEHNLRVVPKAVNRSKGASHLFK